MPKRKHKEVKSVEVTEVDCSNWECDTYYYKGNLPERCPNGHLLLHDTARRKKLKYTDKEELDIQEGGCYSPRPSWFPGRQEQILERSRSPGGTIYCQICGEKIEVNDEGKEEWESKSGNVHATVPHTDHYSSPTRGGGDWIERKRKLRKDPNHTNQLPEKRKQVEREVFNASPLRVAHMMCNCSRPKQ